MKCNCLIPDVQILKIEENQIENSNNKWYNLIFLTNEFDKNGIVCTKEVASRCKAGDKGTLILAITEEAKATPDGKKGYIVSKFKITDIKVSGK